MRFLSVVVSASERSEPVNPAGNTSQSDDKVPWGGGGVAWWRETRKRALSARFTEESKREGGVEMR